jgi:predicted nucleic acid-binding protein
MKKPYLLDTSAIMTFMENEAGANHVEEILRNETVLLPFVVPLEVYYITLQEKDEQTADSRYAMLKALKVMHLWEINEPILLTAARYKGQRSISLADSIIAAFAARHGAVLVHKDPEYETLKDEVEQEILPYKSKKL